MLAEGYDTVVRRTGIVGRHVPAGAPARADTAMTGAAGQARARVRQTPMFATCVPGLGRMLRREAESDGTRVTGTGSHGLMEMVFFAADRAGRTALMRSRLAEDVFAEIGRANRAGGGGPGAVAATAWQPH